MPEARGQFRRGAETAGIVVPDSVEYIHNKRDMLILDALHLYLTFKRSDYIIALL